MLSGQYSSWGGTVGIDTAVSSSHVINFGLGDNLWWPVVLYVLDFLMLSLIVAALTRYWDAGRPSTSHQQREVELCQIDLVCHAKSLTSTSPSPRCSLPLVYIVHQQLWFSSQGDTGLLFSSQQQRFAPPERTAALKAGRKLTLSSPASDQQKHKGNLRPPPLLVVIKWVTCSVQ